jgi:zinc protease
MKKVRSQKSEVRSILFLAFLILSFVGAASAQASGQPTTGSQADLISDFDVNGLKVIVKRRPGAPSVSAGLFVRGGARNLTPQNAGIENLMLSIATEASQKFPRAVMRKELTRMASSLGAGSNEDFSVVSLNSTRPNFDRTWEIFTDAVINPSFTQEDFDLVRNRILTGLRNASISPDSALDVLQNRVIYANHPYSNDPSGTPETIAGFKLEDIRAYHKKIMQTSQLLLVVVGDVDPAVLQKRVADTLGKLPRGDYKEPTLPTLTFDKPSLDVTNREVETNYIKGIFAAPALSNPDYYAMRVAMTILQSRVYNEVRIKRQLSYAPDASMEDDAANTANIYVTTNDANQSVTLMLKEIENLQKSPVDAEIFTNLPGYFLTTYFIKQETNASQVAELARYELIGGGWRNSLKFLDKIREVRPQDVQAVSQKYMKNIRFVVISPTGSAINRQIFLPN